MKVAGLKLDKYGERLEKDGDRGNQMRKIWNKCVQFCHLKIGEMNVCQVCQGMNWKGCGVVLNSKFPKVCEGWRMIQ